MAKIRDATQLRSIQIDIIKKTIEKCFEIEQDINYNEFIYRVCERFHTTRRTAVEYIKTALIIIDFEIATIDGVGKLKGRKVQVLRPMSEADKERNQKLDFFDDGQKG